MKKLGIIGAGQLAQMTAQAGVSLGVDTHCLAATEIDCAGNVATLHVAELQDEVALQKFANSVDVITFENENIPSELVEFLSEYKPVFPGLTALQCSQDRLYEKTALNELDIPTATFFDIQTLDELKDATAKLGFPCVLKTRRFGYDGKGQAILKSGDDLENAWNTFGGVPLILEEFVDFDCEVSIIAVRNGRGDRAFYPLTKNTHEDGILRLSEAPHKDPSLQHEAEIFAKVLMDKWNYVGALAIEFFVKDNHLIANEVAPRVHNSGHWTIEGAVTSQFENHIRAVFNWHLGSTKSIGESKVHNIIGESLPLDDMLANPNAHVHLYGKDERHGRKLGHVTLVDLAEKKSNVKTEETEACF